MFKFISCSLCFNLADFGFSFSFSFLIKNRISEQNYVEAIKEEINKVVKIQEELDIDVLVHGEPEVSFPSK
jgi:hypothetical protein